MRGTKRAIRPGERVRTIGSYSEVMVHFRLAGRPVAVELLRREYDGGARVEHMAQVYAGGVPFSGPILPGEAGIYDDGAGGFYAYEAAADDPGDADPAAVLADCRRMLHDAIANSGASVVVITDLGLNF